MEPKRLYRSITDKKFAGVAGGLAEYFEIDSLLVRLIFVVLALAGGGGVLIYIILWIITPLRPVSWTNEHNSKSSEQWQQSSGTQQPAQDPQPQKADPVLHKQRGNLIGGLVLITLGVLFLADELIPQISFGDLWPVILIVIGIGLLINSIGRRLS